MTERSALATAAAIRAGETSAVAECDAAIARIEAGDGAINAVVVRDFDRARIAAAEADRRVVAGDTSVFLGVPITCKESFDIVGLPSTHGYAEHADFMPTQDAAAVQRMKAAGAIILGKTNVPTGLVDIQSVNPVYGRTLNPHDPARVPGGSSGGSAAALAAGFVPLEMGSDIGGSIRTPAAFCGVWGHKATFGALSKEGHITPRTDRAPTLLSVIGPLARDADDLAAALDVLSDLPLPRATPRAADDWRILLLPAHPLAPTAASISGAVEAVGAAFAKVGAKVDQTSAKLPDLTRQNGNYIRMLLTALARGLPPAGGEAMKLNTWFELIDEQIRCTRAWTALFADYDAVIAPCWGTNAFPHDDTPTAERLLAVDGVTTAFGLQFAYPGLASFPNLPATSVPVGIDPDGLPIGLQVIANIYQDHTAIAVARAAHRLIWS